MHCSFNWSAVQSATHNALCVILNTIEDDGSIVTHSLKLSNKSAANALYRDMTEMHSFYHCDTIGSLVTEQYCRDLKGTIISFFNENTCLGQYACYSSQSFCPPLLCQNSQRIADLIGYSLAVMVNALRFGRVFVRVKLYTASRI